MTIILTKSNHINKIHFHNFNSHRMSDDKVFPFLIYLFTYWLKIRFSKNPLYIIRNIFIYLRMCSLAYPLNSNVRSTHGCCCMLSRYYLKGIRNVEPYVKQLIRIV